MISKAENFRRVLSGEKPQWTPVECPSNPRYGQGAYQFVIYQGALPSESNSIDLWGARWERKAATVLPYIVEHPAASLEELVDFEFPDIENPALWEASQHRLEANREALPIARQVSCLWERLYFLVGFDKALMALVEEPDLVAAVLRRIVDWQIAAGKIFIRAGVQAVRLSDDYGTQNNLLMSPNTWRALIRPQLERIVNFYHQAGLPVALHSCGNLALIMDDLVSLGFAAFNIQTNANDLRAYRRRYGDRFRLWGGVSTQSTLALGTPADIERAVREIWELFGRDGCLILEPDQEVELPDESLAAFWRAASRLP